MSTHHLVHQSGTRTMKQTQLIHRIGEDIEHDQIYNKQLNFITIWIQEKNESHTVLSPMSVALPQLLDFNPKPFGISIFKSSEERAGAFP